MFLKVIEMQTGKLLKNWTGKEKKNDCKVAEN